MKIPKRKKKQSKPLEPMTENSKPYVRGFSPSRRIVERGKYARSCFNCDYYYKAVGDDEEVCQNEQVLPFDVYVDGGIVCCGMWVQSTRRTTAKKLFERGY